MNTDGILTHGAQRCGGRKGEGATFAVQIRLRFVLKVFDVFPPELFL
jgi:hypothetical protein